MKPRIKTKWKRRFVSRSCKRLAPVWMVKAATEGVTQKLAPTDEGSLWTADRTEAIPLAVIAIEPSALSLPLEVLAWKWVFAVYSVESSEFLLFHTRKPSSKLKLPGKYLPLVDREWTGGCWIGNPAMSSMKKR